jgi:hypothetical protein
MRAASLGHGFFTKRWIFPLALECYTLYDTPGDVNDNVKKPKWLFLWKNPDHWSGFFSELIFFFTPYRNLKSQGGR